MKLLLDTHILIWTMGEPARLGPALRELLEDPRRGLCFSVASLWELVIKAALGRDGFQVQPSLLRRTLLDGGFEEIPIEAPPMSWRWPSCRPCTAIPLIGCCWSRRSGKG